MKRPAIITTLVIVVAFLAVSASAQTASGTLTVTATVTGSINLLFNSDASGVTLSGTGTNAATLAFGTVSAYGALGAHVGRSVGGSNFTVSSPFDVQVSKVNSTSATYTLTAQLQNADGTNTWQIGSNTITSASAVTIATTGAYATNVPYTLSLTIPFATSSGTNISNVLNFTATAN
ncbi:MAG: hypothetical protein ABSD88_02675 [Candidatus Korobacteraceae bacterium]|jgi:hypothetical protein